MAPGSKDHDEEEFEGTFADADGGDASAETLSDSDPGSPDEDIEPTLPAVTFTPDESQAETIPSDPGSGVAGAAQEPRSAPSKPAPPGEVFDGRFELLKVLGEGGMGRVYLARDSHLDQNVALKVLTAKFARNDGFRKMFLREISSSRNFVSPNVNQVRDSGIAKDGTLYFTMDLVDGEDLSQLMKREDLLNVRHALDITRQVLEGLKSGHENGFVHRDIKPANIMLASRVPKTSDNPYGVDVRLLDFGIAGMAAELEGGQLVGTPNYMSPEQVQRKPVDLRTDLFAVGIVLYEMIAGARLFDGRTIKQVTSSILETDVAPKIADLSVLSTPLKAILEKALQKDREKRYQSAAEFIRAIEKSKAYQLPKVMPMWATGLLVASLAGAGFLGYLVLQNQVRVDQIQRDAETRLAAAESDARKVRDDLRSLDSDLNKLRTEKEVLEAKLENATSLEDVQEQIQESDKDKELKRLTEKLADKDRELGREVAEHQRTRSKSDDFERRKNELEAERDTLLVRVSELERDLTRTRQQEAPAYQISNRFDVALMAHWAEGRPGRALAEIESLDERFPGEFHGIEYLRLVTRLSQGLVDPTTLQVPITDLADSVLAGMAGFAIDAAWLIQDEDAERGSETERFGRFRELIEGEEGLVAQARLVSVEMAVAEKDLRREIERAPALSGPAAVLDYANANPGPDGSALIGQRLNLFADAFIQEATSGSSIDVNELTSTAAFDEWVRFLTESAEGATFVGSAGGESLMRLLHARRWFSEPDYAGEETDTSLFVKSAAEPAWWSPLRIGHALLQRGSGYPFPESGQLIYRREGAREKVYWDRIKPDGPPRSSAGITTWSSSIRTFNEEGRFVDDAETTIERNGKVFTDTVARSELLRLHAAHQPRVELWKPTLGSLPPTAVTRDAEAFRDRLRQEPIECLVLDDGDTVRWISPQFGLVREDDGDLVTELVSANL